MLTKSWTTKPDNLDKLATVEVVSQLAELRLSGRDLKSREGPGLWKQQSLQPEVFWASCPSSQKEPLACDQRLLFNYQLVPLCYHQRFACRTIYHKPNKSLVSAQIY
eukprot:1063210-Amphidinium_carterae.1